MSSAPVYAVDTEFHRERTYYPKLALVQLAWAGAEASDGAPGRHHVVLVDPLGVDLSALADVLEGPGLAVMHAASQDLEVLQRACGTVPSRLFDTQVAAGFLGFSTPSLAVLADRALDVHLPKTNRLTDWLQRPLRADQRRYAADDVAYLLELAAMLRAELAACGRLAWAEVECEELRRRQWGPPRPEVAWLRLRDSRSLRGRARGIAQSVAAWRERRAASLDRPVRFVLSDLAVVAIANAAPRSLDDLGAIRGVDQRNLRGRVGEELLAAVAEGRSLPHDHLRQAPRDDLDARLRPALALLSAWVNQLGRDLRIEPALLGTRGDLTAFLAGDPEARLGRGWRHQLVGSLARRVVDGELALAFDGASGLVLERRSGEVVAIDLPRPTAAWLGD
ncbi:MAG: HRDC domain-containing protein [Actinomycetota bacterium]|nr:HRDC domain-containing protein [Actinomycetota bacterium]